MMQLSCRSMGENCDFVAIGNSEEEVINKAREHVKNAHPEKWEEMKLMSDAERRNMDADMRDRIINVSNKEEEYQGMS